MPYAAADFVEDLQQKTGEPDHRNEAAKVQWIVADAGTPTLKIDPQFLLPAFLELFANAFRHERGEGAISVDGAESNGEHFIFTSREPKQSFHALNRKLGARAAAHVARVIMASVCIGREAIIEAHGGQLNARYDRKAHPSSRPLSCRWPPTHNGAVISVSVNENTRAHVDCSFCFCSPPDNELASMPTMTAENRRILIIDDERPILLTLEALLGRHGYQPETAATASYGLRVFKGNPPALVLLDLQLPDAEGLRHARRRSKRSIRKRRSSS